MKLRGGWRGVGETSFGKLPKVTGWQPVLPRAVGSPRSEVGFRTPMPGKKDPLSPPSAMGLLLPSPARECFGVSFCLSNDEDVAQRGGYKISAE